MLLKKKESPLSSARVALVHDWLTSFGGAERVLALWMSLFPEAPLYTALYSKKSLSTIFPPERIRTSSLQKLPGVQYYYRKLLSLMPQAFEEFDFRNYDVVLSSSSSCAKGIITPSATVHVSYIHTPMRYAWDLYHDYLESSPLITRWAMRRLTPKIRQWDVLTANRVDFFLCNSQEVARRIRKIYRRKASVIYPPIKTDFFTAQNSKEEPKKGKELGERYLVLSRLVPYKRIDLAVQACTLAAKPLDVVGDGPLIKKLRAQAGPTVQFYGFLNDQEIRRVYRNCRALLFPSFEDFGMVPVEVQACGRPVLAYGRGGALETISEGKTGLFFKEQTAKALMETMEDFESRLWHPQAIRSHAENFSQESHKKALLTAINQQLTQFSPHTDFSEGMGIL